VSGTVTQTITVVDHTPPTIGPPGGDTTIECPGTPSFTPPTANDACDAHPSVEEISDVTTPGNCAGTYSRSKTWRARDCSGNVSGTVTQTITVVDHTPPTIGPPGGDATIECPGTPSFTPPTANDACDTHPSVVEVSDVTTPGSCPGTYTRIKTWRARDCSGNESGPVSQTITVMDTTAPSIGAPGGNATIECPGAPSFTPPGATDLCDSHPQVIEVSDVTTPGSCAGAYTRTKTWQARDCSGNESGTVTQTITVVDTTPPTVLCPHDVVLDASGGCSANNNTTATASDTCAGALPVAPVPPGPYPIGTTVVDWTATDGCGNVGHCQQTVTVRGQICLTKYYDVNANGQQDASELGIPGWRFDLVGPSGQTAYTDSSGSVCVNVLAGTYTITEVAPSTGWANTTSMTRTVTIDSTHCSVACSFGNYCFNPPANGLTLGFWSNKNGAKILNTPANAGWIAVLNSLSLRNPDGSLRQFPANQATATTQLQDWLLKGSATNMASMLSVQLAANVLNGLFNGLAGSTLIVIPGGMTTNGVCVVPFLSVTEPLSCGSPPLVTLTVVPSSPGSCSPFNGTVTIQDVRARAACLLGSYGNTTGASLQRTYQECVKDLLDKMNNNGGGLTQYINPGPSSCPFHTPY
jgi:hypothetical protein